MKKQNRKISSFNLSFLDIMFCGFGAVVLLVLIINSNAVSDNKIKYQDLTSEVDKIKIEIKSGKIYHTNLQEILQNNKLQAEEIKINIEQNNKTADDLKQKVQLAKQQTLALKNHNNLLQSDLKKIDKNNWKKKQEIDSAINEQGNKVRQYEGQGNRQYLTGLKLGGKRVLFLIDNSASMLDETIVNIIVKRNLSNAIKRSQKKWQQAINIVRWIAANLPLNSQFTIVNFNKKAHSLLNDKSYQWIKSSDKNQVNSLFNNLSKLIPNEGTNLRNAFSVIRKLGTKPDNIILITDGLPTLGKEKSRRTKVSPLQRILLFQQAIKIIPGGIPVNTILLPLEGDPAAAAQFWKLAIDTKGSFMTPSRDWP